MQCGRNEKEEYRQKGVTYKNSFLKSPEEKNKMHKELFFMSSSHIKCTITSP